MSKRAIRIKLDEPDNRERKYNVQVVSQAIGLSEGQVSGYFNNQNISVTGGLTAEQVTGLLEYRDNCGRKFKEIDWDAVDNLKAELETLGWEIVDSDELDDKEAK